MIIKKESFLNLMFKYLSKKINNTYKEILIRNNNIRNLLKKNEEWKI